jgi:hypothetical protein
MYQSVLLQLSVDISILNKKLIRKFVLPGVPFSFFSENDGCGMAGMCHEP